MRERRYVDDGTGEVIPLPAGDVTEGVVRVGETVRRPHQPQSFAVAAYLDHVESVGFAGSPRFLGLDDEGRDVLTYVAGATAGAVMEPWVLEDELLVSVAELLLELHAASAGYDPAAEPFPPRPVREDEVELVTHRDVTPQNVTVVDGRAVGIIDFDLAGPSTRFIDSLNTAMHWAPLRDPVDLTPDWDGVDQLARLRLFADTFGWSTEERERLPRFAAERAELSRARMHHNAVEVGGGWARMWAEGVGDIIHRRQEWLLADERRIRRALLR